MATVTQSKQLVPGYCALCVSKCGTIAVVEDGRFLELRPDPSHPTGRAICAKGRAAPELVYHQDRLLYPLKRTRPKGDPDPGWARISWEEALDTTAAALRDIAAESGPESVVFSIASPSTSASDDALAWIVRLMNAYGSPNVCASMELCGWGRYLATTYTFGAGVPGTYMPDLAQAGCILYWGYNPNLARLAHATATADALRRGARLIVVDPRKAGPANRADLWLRVRPGTDAALALGIANVMIARGWFDREFVRDWTNGPLLVRTDNGRFLTQADLAVDGSARRFVAWRARDGRPVIYDPERRQYDGGAEPALLGHDTVSTVKGAVACKTVFQLTAEHCARYPADEVEAISGVEALRVEQAARLLWEARPLAYYAWSGVEMQTNATQIARAIAQLCVLTGGFDAPGGNVLFPSVPQNNVMGLELMAPGQRQKTLGRRERPLGPARWGFVTSDDLYRGILERQPYAVRGLVGFGANLLMAHADPRRGREALKALSFYVHADLFMNPTAELADIVLPVASPFEREALKLGFEISPEAQTTVQLRPKVVEPVGEARADTEIVFELARRLGLGGHFWNGDIEAAMRHQLAPSGLALEDLRQRPEGIRVNAATRYRKFADDVDGVPRGVATPSGKIELYSQTLLDGGVPPLPEFEEPRVSPASQPTLARRFPLLLTCAKNTLYCETQQRGLPSLRRKSMDPEVELHSRTAAARGIRQGDWVRVETPEGGVRARARFNDALEPRVVCGQHGWWQACAALDAPAYDPFSADGANFNLLIGNAAVDPASGSVPHRAYVCEVRLID
ncbi:MAG: molybdopterin-dependent oxidoreductase [Vicinamibacterales bacterium]